MATRKVGRATFTVTRVDEYTVDLGEIPVPVMGKLIKDAAGQWVPSLFIGEADYDLGGDGASFGDAKNVTIEVDYRD